MTDKWDRQRSDDGELEPTLWFGRFQQFLTMGPERSVRQLADDWRAAQGHSRRGSAPGAWTRAAKQWHWYERAEAWDLEQQQRRFAEDVERYERMRQRHASLGRGMQTAATHGLGHLVRRAEEDPESLTATEIRMLAESGISIERTAEGLPTQMVQLMVDLLGMEPDELAEYEARLAQGLGSGQGSDGDARDTEADGIDG